MIIEKSKVVLHPDGVARRDMLAQNILIRDAFGRDIPSEYYILMRKFSVVYTECFDN